MSHLLFAVLAALRAFFRSRLDTSLEILALGHQVAVLKRKRRRAQLTRIDRLFWITLRSAWSRWSDAVVVVKPATVIAWHRAGFRLYWRWRSHSRGGRPRVRDEIKTLIGRMRSENSGWGAPKIHGELLKLGFHISERTVGRYLRRPLPRHVNSSQNWLAFLSNHREVLIAFDFFTVPTLTFKLLYCFLVIEHGRSKVLHCNVTPHPTSDWVVQQLRETFPEADPYRYALFDHDSKFNDEVTSLLTSTGLEPKRTSIQAPWQKGVASGGSEAAAERCWITSSR